jgi:hypothetical protein
MGMSDSILIADAKDAEKFLNASGTPMHMVELSTKSLDCSLTRYVLHSGKLWQRERDSTEEYVIEDGTLKEKITLVPADVTATIHAYCSDPKTPPILSFDFSLHYDPVRERYCSCEWNITIEKGVVTKVEPYLIESREQVIEEAKGKFGESIILDDHPIAKAYFARKAAGKGRFGGF